MPLLAKLLEKLLDGLYGLGLGIFGAKWAIRISSAATLAGLYVACAIAFSQVIVPWLSGWLDTTFGMLLGLLFPPVAGTVLASLVTLWSCVLAKRYTVKLIKATVSGVA
jgi:hypothetical protein